ncbi:MAG: AbrB/MazE/SpoVT family DNA-binding domain-containing protein [Acidimicrobiales bacterium]
MARTTLRAKGQLTLPDDIRKAAHLEEGDLLEAEITADGILLRPQKLIDATQAWFWTAECRPGSGRRMPTAPLGGSRPSLRATRLSVPCAHVAKATASDLLGSHTCRPMHGWRALARTSICCLAVSKPPSSSRCHSSSRIFSVAAGSERASA